MQKCDKFQIGLWIPRQTQHLLPVVEISNFQLYDGNTVTLPDKIKTKNDIEAWSKLSYPGFEPRTFESFSVTNSGEIELA